MARRVLLIEQKLLLASRWRRLRDEARAHVALTCTLLFVGLITLIVCVFTLRIPGIHRAIDGVIQNEFFAGLALALYILMLVIRRRAHLRAEYAQSWLLAAPISRRDFVSVAGMRVALAVCAHTVALVAVSLGLALVNGFALADLGSTVGTMLSGAAIGALGGGVWPAGRVGERSEDSRFIPKARIVGLTASLDGLSRWPIARALAWHRPENSRFLFIIAALSVPAGTPALMGLAILAVWTLGSYVLAVVRAVPSVAREAATWLRPTVLPFASFARALGGRAFVHQVIGTLLLGTIFVSLGGRFVDVLYIWCIWLTTVVMIWAIAARQSYRALPSFARTIGSVLLVVFAETRARGWGVPIAVALTLIHVRAVRHERA